MATSGVVTFRTTRNQIIEGALRLVGAIDPENTTPATTAQITNGSEALNLVSKTLQTQGLQLWKRGYVALFMRTGQQHYVLGNPGPAGDHACISTPMATGFISTTATSCSGTTLVVSGISSIATEGIPSISIASGWYVGIRTASGDFFWTTVNGAPSGTTVTLTDSFGANTLGTPATVYAYQTKSIRPLRILDAFVRATPNKGNDIPVRIISQDEYNKFGQKASKGTPIQARFDPQSNRAILSVYPVSAVNSGDIMFLEAQFPIEDFVSASDDFDMPQEWGELLKYKLAVAIAPEYGVSDTKFKQLNFLATTTFDQVDGWDQEQASVFIQPSNWGSMYNNQGSNNG
jgi:hypothetical protein